MSELMSELSEANVCLMCSWCVPNVCLLNLALRSERSGPGSSEHEKGSKDNIKFFLARTNSAREVKCGLVIFVKCLPPVDVARPIWNRLLLIYLEKALCWWDAGDATLTQTQRGRRNPVEPAAGAQRTFCKPEPFGLFFGAPARQRIYNLICTPSIVSNNDYPCWRVRFIHLTKTFYN